MEETILALLVATFPGVRKDGLKMLARTLALQAETEADAKAAVERLSREGVDGFVRDYRAEVDKAVSDGTHTFEENLKRKFDLVEKKELPEEPAGKGKDTPDPKPNGKEADLRMIVAEAVAGAVKPLQERLEQYERGDVNRTRLQAVTERLNACKDESFRAKALKDYGRMTFDTDEAFKEFLSDTETDVAEANKRVADAKLSAMGRPMFAQKTETGVTAGRGHPIPPLIKKHKRDERKGRRHDKPISPLRPIKQGAKARLFARIVGGLWPR